MPEVSIHLPVPFVCLSICVSVREFASLSTSQSVHQSLCLSVRLSLNASLSFSVCFTMSLPVCLFLSVLQSFRPSVRPFFPPILLSFVFPSVSQPFSHKSQSNDMFCRERYATLHSHENKDVGDMRGGIEWNGVDQTPFEWS